jgi:hypothetical protein
LLHFAETYNDPSLDSPITGPGQRVFDLSLNNIQVSGIDPWEEAGGPRLAVTRTVEGVRVTDGELDIRFTGRTREPMINGFEVVQVSTTLPAFAATRVQAQTLIPDSEDFVDCAVSVDASYDGPVTAVMVAVGPGTEQANRWCDEMVQRGNWGTWSRVSNDGSWKDGMRPVAVEFGGGDEWWVHQLWIKDDTASLKWATEFVLALSRSIHGPPSQGHGLYIIDPRV